MRKLLSAKEIADLGLPGLPSSKVAIAARAEREGWYSEQATGLGGTRRVYELPARYARQVDANEATRVEAASRPGVDLELLRLATVALEEWLADRSLSLAPERKADVIAVLYDYLTKGADKAEMSRMLRALAA